jgi:plastocyanin
MNDAQACSRIALLIILIIVLQGVSVFAEESHSWDCDPSLVPTPGAVRAYRLEGPVDLDGQLLEKDWRRPGEDRLIQNEPQNGCAPRQRTEFWVAYDDQAFYLAARMHDSAPDSICARLGRRDTWPSSDWVFLNLDTFNDDRNAFSFSINPAGVVGDAALYNDGWDDSSWDGVWDVATRIDDSGWTLEARIPFSQLKFPDTEKQVWGINFSRRTLRFNERCELFHNPRGEGGYGVRFPDLVGIEGIKPQNKAELRPYALGKLDARSVEEGDPFRDDPDFSGNVGLDLKAPLSSNLTMNATVNPDFGQVEVDPAVVNLSANETFYQERRPFFVEDANVFRFGNEGTNSNWNFNWMDPMLFYSRRVGRAPQLGIESDHDYVDRPDVATILGAAKVSGKIGDTSVGALTAFTAREKARLQYEGDQFDQVVEPFANYSVVRAKTTKDEGLKGLGIMLTHTTRDLDDPVSQAQLDRRAFTGGIDGWTNIDEDGVWALKGYFSGSHLTGSKEAIESLQASSSHYFQRPDADHLEYDPQATSLSGWQGRLAVNKQSGIWKLNSALGYSSPGYDINDLGFMYRTDMINWSAVGGRRWLEPNSVFRNSTFYLASYWVWDTSGTPTGGGYGAWFFGQLANYWNLNTHVFFNPETNDVRVTRGGPIMRTSNSRELDFNLSTDHRKPWVANLGLFANGNDAGNRMVSGSLSVEFKPASNLSVEVGPRYRWEKTDAQYHDIITDETATQTYGKRYVFSDLEYRQVSLDTRIDWTFTPKLTLQAYVQPLIAMGDYSRPKELARPSSRDFVVYGQDNGSTAEFRSDADSDERWLITPDGSDPGNTFTLSDRDFNFKSLKVNMVLRWEYGPGSTFFFVWTQDRMNFDNPGSFDLGRDTRSLLDAPGEDIFMVKVSQYFSI